MHAAPRCTWIRTIRLTIVDPVDPLVRTKGGELGVRTEIIPNLQSSLALWMLEQDSEILFVGDAGTSERAGRAGGKASSGSTTGGRCPGCW